MSGLPERLGPSACPSPACSPFPACHQPAHILTSRRGSGCVAAYRGLAVPASRLDPRTGSAASAGAQRDRPGMPQAGNLVPDAHLAALALEHGLTVVSTDTDFAKYPGVTWLNPVSATALGLPRRPGMLNRGLSGQHTSNPGPGPEASNTWLTRTKRHSPAHVGTAANTAASPWQAFMQVTGAGEPRGADVPRPRTDLCRPAGHDSQVSAVVPSIAHPGIRPIPIMEPASFDLAAAADGSSGQRARSGQVGALAGGRAVAGVGFAAVGRGGDVG